jgi:hypothetical protein
MRSSVPRWIIAASLIGPACLARADDLERVMHAWCTQADGKTQRLELVSTHDCTEGSTAHIVRERFGSGVSTVKVTFIDPVAKNFHTSYIVGGKDEPFSFSFVSVELRDDTHWKTVIASAPGSEKYEGRPATLRYVRERNGDTIESWKDVQFADGPHDFEPRSRITQTLRR